MNNIKEKLRKRTRRHLRLRMKVFGTTERPRLSVCKEAEREQNNQKKKN